MKKIGIIRGKFLTKYDMEPFELLTKKYDITAFGSKNPFAQDFKVPLIKLWSPMDLPDFPYKMQFLNRLFVDAHYLLGLEEKLKGFDIAHTAETYFNFTRQILNAKQKGYVKKVVISVLENIAFNNEEIWGKKSFKKRAIKETDHFIALSKGAKVALIKEGVADNNISLIGFGINTKKFYPADKRKSNKIKILFAGRIEAYKGIFDVLEVFNLVSTKNNDLELTIVGKGSKEKEVRLKTKQLGINDRVKFKNLSYKEMPQVYREADIFFAPSKRDKYWIEQFGMVFLEAMASGLPIISTKSGAIPEVVGNSGFLSQEEDIKNMENTINKLIEDRKLRNELGEKARQRAIDVFDISVISKKIDRVYERLL